MRNFDQYEIVINPAQDISLDSLDEKIPEFGSYISLPPLEDIGDVSLTDTGLVPQWQLQQGFELGLIQSTPMLDHFYEDETIRQERRAREKSKENGTKPQRAPLHIEPRRVPSRFSEDGSGGAKDQKRPVNSNGNHDRGAPDGSANNDTSNVADDKMPTEDTQKPVSGQEDQDQVSVDGHDTTKRETTNTDPLDAQHEHGKDRHSQEEKESERKANEKREQQERDTAHARTEDEDLNKQKDNKDFKRREAQEATQKRREEQERKQKAEEKKRHEAEEQRLNRLEEQRRRHEQEEQKQREDRERRERERVERKRREDEERKREEAATKAAHEAKEREEQKRREAEDAAQKAKQEEQRKAHELAEAEAQRKKVEEEQHEQRRRAEQQMNIKYSCSNMFIDRKFMLRCFCKTKDGRQVAAQFNLNRVISFDGMRLQWGRGGYTRHARRAWGGADGIWAECRVGRAWQVVSLLDMHKHFYNDNGALRYSATPLEFD